MKCAIMYSTPANWFALLSHHDTIADARVCLSRILKAYKYDYHRGLHVRDYCYWYDKNKIVVHEVLNTGVVSGDSRRYWIETIDY